MEKNLWSRIRIVYIFGSSTTGMFADKSSIQLCHNKKSSSPADSPHHPLTWYWKDPEHLPTPSDLRSYDAKPIPLPRTQSRSPGDWKDLPCCIHTGSIREGWPCSAAKWNSCSVGEEKPSRNSFQCSLEHTLMSWAGLWKCDVYTYSCGAGKCTGSPIANRLNPLR